MSHTPLEPESVSPSGRPSSARRERLATAGRRWQRELADLGGPNTLLWHQDLPSGTLDLTTAHPGGVSMLMAGRATRLSDLVREPSAFAEARRRAEVIRDKAGELADERGLITGFMAIGMASWSVPGARREPQAPVLLRACTLRPTGPAHRDYDIDLSRGVELNPVLVNYLASEQGLRIDAEAIADLAHVTRRFDPLPAFRELTRLCRSVPGFRVADRKVIATFPYAKLPMVADIAGLGDELAGHDLLAVLAGETPVFGAADRPAPRPVPPELLVLDADAQQSRVIDAVRAGSDAIVHAPVGSGRTQTVANLVAGLAADGRRVLVVSEKRAPLERLVGRLQSVGLDHLVADLPDGALDHGRLARLVRADIENAGPISVPENADDEAALAQVSELLEGHREATHQVRDPWGVSVHDGLAALARLTRGRRPPVSRVRLARPTLTALDRAGAERATALLVEAAAQGAWSEERSKDPWAGARVTDAADVAKAAELCRDLSATRLQADGDRLAAFLRETGLPPARTPADWGVALTLVEDVRATLEAMSPDVYSPRLQEYVDATASGEERRERGVRMAWWTRWGLKREAKTLVRPEASGVDLHDTLAAAADQRTRWRTLSGGASTPRVPDGLDDCRRIWNSLQADLDWLGRRLATTDAGGDLIDTPLPELKTRLALLASRGDRLEVLPVVVPLLDELRGLGLGELADDLALRRVPTENVAAEAEFVWWRSLLDLIAIDDPRIGGHDPTVLRRRGEEFDRLDTHKIRSGVGIVDARVRSRLADAVAAHPGQVSHLRAEAGRTRRHQPLRDLLATAGDVVFAARPCWTMSPLVVASVLPTDAHFDVVVIEGAASLPASHVVSALARADQVVLIGDDHELTPTGFSTSATAGQVDDDLVPARQIDSVLDLAAGAAPDFRLTAMYRARDERLSAFLNAHLYDGDLLTYPGTGTERAVRLVGVGERRAVAKVADGDDAGEEAVDLAALEVERVVEAVIEHARSGRGGSLGVVTLTHQQSRAIIDALRTALDREGDPTVIDFFDESVEEPFFVRTVERAQGDVRDAVILSVGFVRAVGATPHRFGLLGLDGGERRLAAALAVPRERLTIVSSLTTADLDGGRLASGGTRLLRDLLEYAESGGSLDTLRTQGVALTGLSAPSADSDDDADEGSGTAPDDAVLAEFAVRLRQEGLVVHERHGMSREPLDLAVEDPYLPGRMLVAVDSDGPRYARVGAIRDRERLRGEHLRRLGWEYVRVNATDVFADPVRDVARVLDAVRSADARGSGRGPARRQDLRGDGTGW